MIVLLVRCSRFRLTKEVLPESVGASIGPKYGSSPLVLVLELLAETGRLSCQEHSAMELHQCGANKFFEHEDDLILLQRVVSPVSLNS